MMTYIHTHTHTHTHTHIHGSQYVCVCVCVGYWAGRDIQSNTQRYKGTQRKNEHQLTSCPSLVKAAVRKGFVPSVVPLSKGTKAISQVCRGWVLFQVVMHSLLNYSSDRNALEINLRTHITT